MSQVLPSFDSGTRTLKARLELDNPGYRLRPEMFVDVEFESEMPEALVVPHDAVLDTGMRKVVFVDRGEGTSSRAASRRDGVATAACRSSTASPRATASSSRARSCSTRRAG